MNLSPQDSACRTMNLLTMKSIGTTREQIMCIHINILILFTFLGCIAHHTVAFAHRHFSVRPTTMTLMSQYEEEKKDDGILYWEPSFNGFEPLPSLKTRPKMIVFDKDGTNESWWKNRFMVVVIWTCRMVLNSLSFSNRNFGRRRGVSETLGDAHGESSDMCIGRTFSSTRRD